MDSSLASLLLPSSVAFVMNTVGCPGFTKIIMIVHTVVDPREFPGLLVFLCIITFKKKVYMYVCDPVALGYYSMPQVRTGGPGRKTF